MRKKNERPKSRSWKILERTTGFEPATPHLGKVVLYQLSHVRKLNYQSQLGGDARIRTGVKALQASALPLWPRRQIGVLFLRAD